MTDLEKEVIDKYGNHLRIRVCGIWIKDSEILLVHHQSLGPNGSLWAPPGGGVNFGESLESALQREFLEETNATVTVAEFLFVNEHLSPPFHAIELFFRVEGDANQIKLGTDPEMEDSQIITEVAFKNLKSLQKKAPENLHKALRKISDADELFNIKGCFKSQ